MRVFAKGAEVTESARTLASLARRLKAASRWRNESLPALWFLTDEARTADPISIARHLPPGTGIVLRHYQDPNRAELARRLADLARGRSLTLLIGADGHLARTVGAHGVHVPRWARRKSAQTFSGGIRIYSAHGLSELQRAVREGADAVFLGPVFATESHPGAVGLGRLKFTATVSLSVRPVLALGGIDQITARQLRGSGAYGFGAIGALLPSTD